MGALKGIASVKLVGITTDGESANTGSNGSLWKLPTDRPKVTLLTVWCIAHRSDLAMEQIVATVPGLKI